MSFFRNRVFLSVSLAHLFIDIFSSAGSVIVTFLSIPLGLSTAQIGLAISGYQLINGSVQPFFGWLADRFGSRWLGPSSVAWTVTIMMLSIWLAETTQNYSLFLFLFMSAALGSAAFHPLATMHASTSIPNRAATSTAIFFMFGQSGLALGPLLAGILLDRIGTIGLYIIALLVVPLVMFMGITLRHTTVERRAAKKEPATEATGAQTSNNLKPKIQWGAIIILFLLMGSRSWAAFGTVAFLPKIFQDMGWSPTAYGSITAAYWMAAAVAGVIAGNLADRWGRRQVIFISLVLGSIPIYVLPLNDGWLAFASAIAIGGLMGASHSILMVIAQDLLPSSKSLASGLALGYMFAVGAVAAWAIGTLADTWTLTTAIQISAPIGVIGAFFTLLLPSTRQSLR